MLTTCIHRRGSVGSILRKIVLNWELLSLHLNLENVHLVEEKDDGDRAEPPVSMQGKKVKL